MFVLLIAACVADKDSSTAITGVTSGATTGATTGTGTTSGATSSGPTTGTTTGTNAGATGTLPLTVTDADVLCDAPATAQIIATPTDPGEINVYHDAIEQGCCPTFGVQARIDHALDEIQVVYSLTNDVCDCICTLDARYHLSGIPAGTWTLVAGTESTPVTVL